MREFNQHTIVINTAVTAIPTMYFPRRPRHVVEFCAANSILCSFESGALLKAEGTGSSLAGQKDAPWQAAEGYNRWEPWKKFIFATLRQLLSN